MVLAAVAVDVIEPLGPTFPPPRPPSWWTRSAEDALEELATRLRATVERERRLRREGALRESIDPPLRAAGGWCAPGGADALPAPPVTVTSAPPVTVTRDERAPSWWTRDETPAQRRDRERRFRWAEEDEWLRVQNRLATTSPEVEVW